MENEKVRIYESINVKPSTKSRVDKLYYMLKIDKKYKSYDDFVNEILDLFESHQ